MTYEMDIDQAHSELPLVRSSSSTSLHSEDVFNDCNPKVLLTRSSSDTFLDNQDFDENIEEQYLNPIATPSYSPQGTAEWIPSCPDEKKPFVGKIFQTMDDAILFYRCYAQTCHFKERLSTGLKENNSENGTGQIYLKYVFCNREGIYKKRKGKKQKDEPVDNFHRGIKRIGCRARMGIRLCKDGFWKVYTFIEAHNHKLVSPNSAHHTLSDRNLTYAHMKFIFDNTMNNIGPNKSYKLMKEHCGGYQNVGASLIDFKNFCKDLKTHLKDSDTSIFINNFKTRMMESGGGFFFDYCVDEENHLKCVFWADSISRKNYALFGDMLSFDTTYDTNKYSLKLGLFTGVDHHKRCVNFGTYFVTNEDIPSFTWVMNCFVRCNGNKEPQCMITDQDPAMLPAFKSVFKSTKHRLCMWHIMKKVSGKISKELRETDFLPKLVDIVWNRDLEEKEFEENWKLLMTEFELQENDWFCHLYAIRKMWIPTYFRDLFLGGLLRTTQISESENNFFTTVLNPHLTLVEFSLRFQTSLDAQRHLQSKMNTETTHTNPKLFSHLKIEKHASEYYTHTLFYLFQNELKSSCFSCGVKAITIENNIEKVEVDDNFRKKTYEVQYKPDTGTWFCSCCMYESMGLLCRHILFRMNGKTFKKYQRHIDCIDGVKKL